ncbi:response regulator transcription factor [Sulfurimonas sp. MAG313]|nr:response regulator transcription factor [Sulfurimonas sp. MAG313]MDF1880418.1 response regulator transcription factor [Sulfurimonas sp. MAG313]
MQKNILLLEDDIDLADTLKELLQSEGYSVYLVNNGSDAADISYDKVFDLYVFDINVPDINGLELLEGLREAQDRTPAIFISALTDLNSIAKGFEVGAEDYIKKPFFPQELLIRIRARFSQELKEIVYDSLSYNTQTGILKNDGKILALSMVQERLFKLFIHNIGQVMDTKILMDCLEHPSSSALRVALSKLKQTTGLNFKNIRATGYVLEKS